MPVNLSFGPVLLPANLDRDFGPYTVKAADDQVVLTIDRTRPNGLDANPGAAIDITIYQSTDGGTTWVLFIGGHVIGGIQTYTDRQGVVHQYTESVIQSGVEQARSLLKATVSVGDVPVRVAGTFVVS